MSGKNVLIVSEIKGVPIDPNAQDDNLRGDIFALDRKIAQNDSDKRAIQRMSDDKRITPKQASTANQIIDANNAKLKEKRSELQEKLKKNEAARAAKQATATKAADKPVVPNVQGLLFSRTVTVDQIINNALGGPQEYRCTADKPRQQVLQERFNDHLSGRAPLPPAESLKLRADLQAEFDREHPGQQSAWPAYSNDERAYIKEQRDIAAANDRNLTLAVEGGAFTAGTVAAGYTAGADPRKINMLGTAAMAAEGLVGARRGAQGKKSPPNSAPANARSPLPTPPPRPTPQSSGGGLGNGVAVEVKSGAANSAGAAPVVRANKVSGDAARDFIAAREGGVIEQNFRVTGGLRRVDVLKEGNEIVAIESKVGRTSLDSRIRQELARDVKMLRSGQVDRVVWEFSESATTGRVGPTPALQQKLDKFGIEIKYSGQRF